VTLGSAIIGLQLQLIPVFKTIVVIRPLAKPMPYSLCVIELA
jgi:hypothetical protein